MCAQHPDDTSSKPAALTVLLVEDNLHNRRIFSGILTHFGYTVVEALNGKEAVEKAVQVKPNIILMDLSLPIMDGWEATQKIKKIESLREIPIIALTAHAMDGDEDRAFEAGCDGYLSKPISPKRLVAEVNRILGQNS